MLDPTNSTQRSNKGETNIRPTPIGGPFGFFEEKEPEIGAILEKCMSAIGNISFQAISKLFEAGKWTTLAVGEGVKDSIKDASVSEKPLTPEAQKKNIEKQKKVEELQWWFKHGAIQTGLINPIVQEKRVRINELNGFQESYRLTVDDQGNVQTKYRLDAEKKELDTKESNEAQIKAQRAQSFARATGKGTNLSNRTDAQEGQSNVANAITTAG